MLYVYSGTSLIRTPLGQTKVSLIEIDRGVLNSEVVTVSAQTWHLGQTKVSLIQGVLIERFHCIRTSEQSQMCVYSYIHNNEYISVANGNHVSNCPLVCHHSHVLVNHLKCVCVGLHSSIYYCSLTFTLPPEVSVCNIISILCLWYIQLSFDWYGTGP